MLSRIRNKLSTLESPLGLLILKGVIFIWMFLILIPGFLLFQAFINFAPVADEKIFAAALWGTPIYMLVSVIIGYITLKATPGSKFLGYSLAFLLGLIAFISSYICFVSLIGLINGLGLIPANIRSIESTVTKIQFNDDGSASIGYENWDDPATLIRTTCKPEVANLLVLNESKVTADIYQGRLGYNIFVDDTLLVDGMIFKSNVY